MGQISIQVGSYTTCCQIMYGVSSYIAAKNTWMLLVLSMNA